MKKLFLFWMTIVTAFLRSEEVVITTDLLRLLDELHIEHKGTLSSIVELTQKEWLRPADKERWEIKKEWSLEDRQAVLNYYQKTGKLQEKLPSKREYQSAIICGSTVSNMQQRIQFFEKIWNQGICFQEVVFLTGARPLDPRIETAPAGCRTEDEAMMVLWKNSPLFDKVSCRNLPHPMIPSESGLLRRPTTIDTFKLWLTTRPNQGPHLIISSQPYCCYFEAICRRVFDSTVAVEVIGPKAEAASQQTGTLLDNLARWLYVEGQCSQASRL